LGGGGLIPPGVVGISPSGGTGGFGVGRSGGEPGEKAIHSQCGGGGLGQKLKMKNVLGSSDVGGNRIGCVGRSPVSTGGSVIVASPVIVALLMLPPCPVISAFLISICIMFSLSIIGLLLS
jgi:hypothetical protein